MDKEVVVHTQWGVNSAPKRSGFESIELVWVGIEPVTGSESGREKDNACVCV